ncbi:winged helix-turn-helix transcriptional regulator [Amycolatopsis alkalitolerans]|uniref:Helix-turn-helix transcriptional regulator n=1 Tax=Amycolatopsis alkalitolerans TaxID=2547244 RepID=A0A5C4M1Y0_9PSEU|nr:helix-turn-helix domain-containing protein [Amycolatopsis alkalitolerans]TNC26898.1 helix-turn-helix transcriptional regulator [Amycolatopsis alkalitolerans]
MKRTSFANWPCSIARTMDLLGDWWTPLVLREAFYGVQRFDAFQQTLGIARNTLAERLRRLVGEGLLEKRPYQSEPVRYDYVLTEKGKDFFGVLAAMSRWGDRWLAGEEGVPVVFRHRACGHETHAEVVCAHCGAPLTAEDTTAGTGPGFPERLKGNAEVRRRFSPA